MTRRVLFSVAALTLAATAASAQTPSTNDLNRTLGWAHVDQTSIGVGTSDFAFISTRAFYSCFEYRTDGDTSQKIDDTNYNAEITDGLYPYFCTNNNTINRTITAVDYIEIRMVFGAERDERFGWTKFYVLGAMAYKARPWVYDPDDTDVASAAWVTKAGLVDAGGSDHALYLAKQAPTSANAASGVTIDGVNGLLTELGFDSRNDGHCGAGAPRFNVYTTSGTYYFFGCAYGSHTALTPEWTRVRFRNADAYPADGVTPFPGFGAVFVTGIDIVFDEGTDVGPGFVYLDSIDVNGVIMGKPGIVK
jgi:hypothetical protein